MKNEDIDEKEDFLEKEDFFEKEEKKLSLKSEERRTKKRDLVISSYENDIKKYRDFYFDRLELEKNKKKAKKKLNNIESDEDLDEDDFNNDILFTVDKNTIAETFIIIFSFSLLFVFNFNIFSVILTIIFYCLATYLFCYYNRNNNDVFLDEYKRKIFKLGYFSLDEFEEDLEEFITGPNGIYYDELQRLIEEYNVDTNNIDFVFSSRGIKYYVWADYENLYLLNSDLYEKPFINKIPFENVFYYRVDYESNLLIIKILNDELYFEENSIVVFSKYLRNKEFSKNNLMSPRVALNDFKDFMFDYKKMLESGEKINFYKNNYDDKILISSFGGILLFVLFNLVPIDNTFYSIFCQLGTLFFVFVSIHYLFCYLVVYFLGKRDVDRSIDDLKFDTVCLSKFNELKMCLGIDKNSCDTIYNLDGYSYYIWKDNDDYIHLFFNEIYYDVLYYVFTVNEISNYSFNYSGCSLEVNGVTLLFSSDSRDIIEKYIKN